MKKQFQITIQRVDNGFTIRGQSDTPSDNGQKIATTEEEAKTLATAMIDIALQIAPPLAPPKPQ